MSHTVAVFDAGGVLFKDKVHVIAVRDPKVENVVCHVSYIERGLNPLSDPSGSSVSCSRVGPISFKSNKIDLSSRGEEVFSQRQNLLFKELKIRRCYDRSSHSLAYISYSDRMLLGDKQNRGDRFKTSISTVPLAEHEVPY